MLRPLLTRFPLRRPISTMSMTPMEDLMRDKVYLTSPQLHLPLPLPLHLCIF